MYSERLDTQHFRLDIHITTEVFRRKQPQQKIATFNVFITEVPLLYRLIAIHYLPFRTTTPNDNGVDV